MLSLKETWRRWEFELRIVVSFLIVALICAISFAFYPKSPLCAAVVGRWFGLSASSATTLAYLLASVFMAAASLLRMWAGSLLTSRRMMRFAVQSDGLVIAGPYRLVRNPIYLSDLIAFAGFALILPHVGLLMPFLLWLHYHQIIRYEEQALQRSHGASFERYASQVNRLFPGRRALKQLATARREFIINRDGLMHNALYLLFIPGFLFSARTHNLWHALLIGLPAVGLWTYLHVRIGLSGPSPFSSRIKRSKP
ncbi:methyltransferase family protein [Caldithrix abyssi]